MILLLRIKFYLMEVTTIMHTLHLKGVMPPMLTPFTSDGRVDYEKFAGNIEKWNAHDLAGYLVTGSNSETPYLTEVEKLRLVELTVQHAAPGKYVMAGTGLESLAETIRLTNQCADLGVQSALVLTPSYYGGSMTSAALVDYFTRVAEGSTIPVLIYNVPKFTHVNIKADTVAQLAGHPNIIGMKDSTGDIPQLATFCRVTAGQDFTILVGTAGAWYPALAMGVTAGIHALANCCPEAGIAAQKAFDTGDWMRSRAIYQAAFPLNAAVTGTYGVAGLKYACELAGYHGGYVRCPLQELDAGAKQAVEKIVRKTEEDLSALGVNGRALS